MKVEKEDYKEEKTTSAGTKERKTLTSGTSVTHMVTPLLKGS